MPETWSRSPGCTRRPFALSTKTPPVVSCMKKRPCRDGSPAVTTPVTLTFNERDALSAGSEMISRALVKRTEVDPAGMPVWANEVAAVTKRKPRTGAKLKPSPRNARAVDGFINQVVIRLKNAQQLKSSYL